MGIKQVFAVASAVVSFVFCSCADTLYMTASDNGASNSSFNNWDISGTPKGAPTSGNDYVCDTFNINAPNSGSTQSFGGNSLRLGDVTQGKSANLILRRTSNTTVDFPNKGLILEGGSVQPWINTTTYGGKQYTFTGTIDVRSPQATPFEFCIADKNKDHLGMTYVLTATFKGEAGTGVALVNRYDNPTGSVTLNPSVANFAGAFIIGGGTPACAVKCNLQGSPTMPGGLWIKALGEVVPQYAGGTQWTVGFLRLDAKSTLETHLTNDPKTSTITVTDSLTTAYPVNLTFPSARTINTGTGYIWNVLTLPLEKKDQIHPEHFVLATQEPAGLFPDAFPSVELRVTEKNDLAVLELVQRQVVQNNVADDAGYGYSKQNFEFPTSMTNAMAWSNKNLPMPTIDYVAAYNLNAATPSQCEDGVYAFPGASLTVKSGVTFCEAAHEFTIPVLRLESNARFWPLGEQYDDATAVVKGRIHMLQPTSSDYALLRVRRQSTVDIEAELTGTGNLQVQPNANDSTGSVAVFDHDNSAFLGKIRIQSNTYTNDMFTKGQTFVLKAANNVGGPLGEFAADALEVRYFSTLEVTNDLVFATANRGLTVEDAQVKVGTDATFTFANDIAYVGPLVKTGAGRLVLGGAANIVESKKQKTLTVEEGTLAVTTDTALDGVAVTFTGGALAVNPATAGDYGMKGPFSGNLPVAFDLPADEETHEYSNVAVCTVDASANVSPKAVRIPRHRVVFHWRDNNNGTKTLLADISRTGCAIILR